MASMYIVEVGYSNSGILILQVTHRLKVATLKKMETSIAARLGLSEKTHKMRKNPNALFIEVKRENWPKETVIIV